MQISVIVIIITLNFQNRCTFQNTKLDSFD